MKLRIILQKGKKYFYCPNGSILKATEQDLLSLLNNFKKPNQFKGNDGFWSNKVSDMEDAPGQTLAYVDDANKLIVISSDVFIGLLKENVKYISAAEYAVLHGKSKPTIKSICPRIEGAYKTSAGWLIPENAPYPEDKRANNGGHSTAKKKVEV